MKDEFLKDVNGKESAKRVWASRYLWFGLFLPISWFLIKVASSVFSFEFNLDFPANVWYGVVGFGAAILGVTIFETKNK